MKKTKLKPVQFRRKRDGKTDYKKRLTLLLSGKNRLVIRKSQKNVYASIVEYHPEGDRILCGVTSKELVKLGWKHSTGNIPSAYLVGLLIAKKVKSKKLNTVAILDTGMATKVRGSRLFALLKGAVDGGLEIPVDKSIYPDEKRINGKHISDYAKSNPEHFKKYDSKNIETDLKELKSKLLKV